MKLEVNVKVKWTSDSSAIGRKQQVLACLTWNGPWACPRSTGAWLFAPWRMHGLAEIWPKVIRLKKRVD
jgi:hypothetical protein